MVSLISGVPADELNSSQPRASQEPAPKVVEEQATSCQGIEDQEEAHELMFFLVDVVVPNADDGDQVVPGSNHGV